jgi:Prokaryotic membrane lipoprotein lipid attachment site
MNRYIIFLLAVATLAACSDQQRALPGSSAQYLNVEGKRIQVRVSPFGGPGEYRLMAARDAIGWSLDDENEKRRSEYAANYYMKQTCAGRGYQVLEAGMLDTINYFARFKCNG